jgi:hypothetical protein
MTQIVSGWAELPLRLFSLKVGTVFEEKWLLCVPKILCENCFRRMDQSQKVLLLVVMKSYFDGGNKADSEQYDVVSLAAASATSDEWDPFERDWREMLKRHHADYLHTTDAVSRVNHYDGWTETEADSFLRDCARIAAKHFIRLRTEYDRGEFGIYCFVVSIVLPDFVEHCQKNQSTPNTDANQGLFRQAIGDTLLWSGESFANCDQIHCFFDRGEPFYGYLVNVLESKRASKDAWLLNKIQHRTESNSQLIPALQLADLFAWV